MINRENHINELKILKVEATNAILETHISYKNKNKNKNKKNKDERFSSLLDVEIKKLN